MVDRRNRRDPSSDSSPEPDIRLSDGHTALYLALIESPSLTRNDMIRRGFAGEYVDHVMPAFVRRGLARPLSDHAWEAVDPDIALPNFAARLEEYAQTVRASTAALSRTFNRRLEERADLTGYERLTSVQDIALATQQVMASADAAVIGVRNDSPYTRYLIGLPQEFHRTPSRNQLGRRLSARVTMDAAMLAHPGLLGVVRARESTGEQYRYATHLPLSVLVSDRGHAVVDVDAADGSASGLLLSSPKATAVVRGVAEWAWRLASPWRLDDEADALTPRDRRILELLSSGVSDSAIAKQLQVSQRTVERRVRELMDRVGAETRFQAGVLAAKSGLI